MATKVFGIGLNKTGTTTLAECLRTLGFRHTSCSLKLTRAYQEGNLEPLYEHADQFESFEDWPWPLVYPEMDRRYVDAKFVLTRRSSAEEWFDSLKRHALRTGPTEYREVVYGHSMPLGRKEEYISVYERHNQNVRDYFSGRPEKLLEVCWTHDGWKELCDFLDLEIPSQEFPHENEGRSELLSTISYLKGYLAYTLNVK